MKFFTSLFPALAVLVLAVGCESKVESNRPTGAMASNQATDRDNTAVNARDRDTAAKTPMDQKENQHDVTITAEIRKKIEATAISENAKNVKVVTADGHVVLRGPVTSMDEKTKIAMIAEQIAGAGNVDDKLEVEVKK